MATETLHHAHHTLRIIDTHFGGDISRVVTEGLPRVPGDTVLEKREWLEAEGDALRRLLLTRPYGEPSMCADVIVEPGDPRADAGFVIMEAMGYPHFSGSNAICVAAALLESGTVPMGPPGRQQLQLEAPAGLVPVTATHDGRRVTSVTLECDPAWVVDRSRTVELPDLGAVTCDVVWSGCFYAVVEGADHDLDLHAHERPRLEALGRELCRSAEHELDLVHPEFGDTGGLSFVCFTGPVAPDRGGTHELPGARVATYVHPGVLCRCPTGTGTAARLATLVDRGRMDVGDGIRATSPTGSEMEGHVVGRTERCGRPATLVAVTGCPRPLGHTDLLITGDEDVVDTQPVLGLLAGG